MKNEEVVLLLSEDGDPFASKHYRGLLHDLGGEEYSRVQIYIATNGLLLTESEWIKLSPIHKRIKKFQISIDAAEAETYEDLRRPGKWADIVKNMNFLSELRRRGEGPPISIRFVVQTRNYRQMPAFVRMGKEWGVEQVRFQRLVNNGAALTPQELRERDVCNRAHPEHEKLLEVFRDPEMASLEVDLRLVQHVIEGENHFHRISIGATAWRNLRERGAGEPQAVGAGASILKPNVTTTPFGQSPKVPNLMGR